ncbi:FAD-dependent oxidoreductase [Glacieibacterium frigidum]|uniref:FAD-dependent oxidoreductase n=1 Tax=Glacieibacterium frigidum TaxID=2593303 RepID=A0A552U8A6_9SPHN|nr:FAD-dependent oxidoreductase [Glacieibacterium frigidum]TRW14448.1 FAD-dependent oxidoreductase [Glacieibacterium frigidum]
MTFDADVPVLVVGGGACGCVAALAARDAGAEVLLIEQDARPMGSTGMSQGMFCAAGTKAQAAAGIDDDAETFFADIMAKSRGLADPVVARAIAHGSGPAADWLKESHDLPWTVDRAFRPSYGNSRLRVHGWPDHSGSDMVSLLHQRLGEAGVDVMLQARLADVIADPDGRVMGVEIARPGGAIERIGCGALILASGGFAANRAMVAEFLPEVADARNIGHEGSQGIAMTIGRRLGAELADMGAYQGYAMLTDPQGISVPPNVLMEGGFIVNADGVRFTDEMADIAGMVRPVLAQPGGYCWLVYDAGIEARCAHIPDFRALVALNAARTADSIAGLAAQIGVNGAALAATLDTARSAQRDGVPDPLGRDWGSDLPPSAPFRALKVVGAIYHTQGGLQIDGEARVLCGDGSALPNLFAGGGAARSVSGPAHWGYLPAMGLCTAVTLGWLAGTAAGRQVTGNRPPAAPPMG